MISYDDFSKIDMRVGKVIKVEDFPEAVKPAFKLYIDFGPLGIKKSSAQITNYKKEELLGRQVICVVNFFSKKIGSFISEVLTLGAERDNGGYELLRPDPEAKLGKRIF
ncbi:molecular chaperone [Candidatus Gottesmanbacteria bacterium RBG_13_37_7]|uniref:Molecular chaperone n=1 Tax=Candidatus Gottesmanbacteria bacterium RBG_13_37_7 TaxID=1798369 RepID=A0A1F5YG42_9BACT|nr:MAG: molecular chaperone [Candidatus Gottesmanbacteria bacterium RBG_13_37_7]